jgi:hypothetical protein
MGDGDMTPGEMGRAITRIEDSLKSLTQTVQTAIVPISFHGEQIKQITERHEELAKEVKEVTRTSNRIAGGGALLAVLAGLLPWPWKH